MGLVDFVLCLNYLFVSLNLLSVKNNCHITQTMWKEKNGWFSVSKIITRLLIYFSKKIVHTDATNFYQNVVLVPPNPNQPLEVPSMEKKATDLIVKIDNQNFTKNLTYSNTTPSTTFSNGGNLEELLQDIESISQVIFFLGGADLDWNHTIAGYTEANQFAERQCSATAYHPRAPARYFPLSRTNAFRPTNSSEGFDVLAEPGHGSFNDNEESRFQQYSVDWKPGTVAQKWTERGTDA